MLRVCKVVSVSSGATAYSSQGRVSTGQVVHWSVSSKQPECPMVKLYPIVSVSTGQGVQWS